MSGRIKQAPERALEHAIHSRTFIERVAFSASGERRARALHIAKILTAAIEQMDAMIAEGNR